MIEVGGTSGAVGAPVVNVEAHRAAGEHSVAVGLGGRVASGSGRGAEPIVAARHVG